MTTVFYLDTYFFLNAAMDLVTCAAAALICAEKPRFWRLAAGAVFGGGAACVFVLVSMRFWVRLILSFAAFLLMMLIVFGQKPRRRFLSLVLFGFLSALFLGGVVTSLSYWSGADPAAARVTFLSFLALLAVTLVLWTLWGARMKRRMESSIISLSVRVRDREAQFYGLVDSGSFLRDPKSGDPVILLKASGAAAILPREELERLRGESLSGASSGAIPVRTVSGKGSVPVFRPDKISFHSPVFYHGKKHAADVLIALDFTAGGFAGCPCLVPLCAL